MEFTYEIPWKDIYSEKALLFPCGKNLYTDLYTFTEGDIIAECVLKISEDLPVENIILYPNERKVLIKLIFFR
jgi:hypothetical protein